MNFRKRPEQLTDIVFVEASLLIVVCSLWKPFLWSNDIISVREEVLRRHIVLHNEGHDALIPTDGVGIVSHCLFKCAS